MSDEPPRAVSAQFLSTPWSLIARARDPGAGNARAALAALCELYWYPLYAYVRRRVKSADAALDLTQGFFAHLLEKNALASADRTRGKFRTFLLACCDHYLGDERDRGLARKRGGGRAPLSLDLRAAEERYRCEPADPQTPERLYDRRWALTLLENTFARLEREYAADGRAELYRLLQPALAGRADALAYADVGAALGMTESAVKKAAQRLRERYGQILRELVAATVERPDQVDEEVRDLFAALAL
jgi:RNA polymerase sigma-70 factor (ECF subfamily)